MLTTNTSDQLISTRVDDCQQIVDTQQEENDVLPL